MKRQAEVLENLLIAGHQSCGIPPFSCTPGDPQDNQSLSSDGSSPVVIALHNLAHSILTAPAPEGPASRWNSVMECFLAVYFVNDSGTFPAAHHMTNCFARLKYICRCDAFFASLGLLAREDFHGSHLQLVSVFRLSVSGSPSICHPFLMPIFPQSHCTSRHRRVHAWHLDAFQCHRRSPGIHIHHRLWTPFASHHRRIA